MKIDYVRFPYLLPSRGLHESVENVRKVEQEIRKERTDENGQRVIDFVTVRAAGKHPIQNATFFLELPNQSVALVKQAYELIDEDKKTAKKSVGHAEKYVKQVENGEIIAYDDEPLTEEKAVQKLIILLKDAGMPLPQIGGVLRDAGFGDESREDD